ncbi:YbaY family lipoprotein [Oscillatoria laete-virens NRMC-F 0139]|nr:YbaY family lipoprotein [Oscillatoria laete-virens]MDL5052888.1 YbaY family lipoprotein [Oscillatoria laete-virens NRMC-F 0139]
MNSDVSFSKGLSMRHLYRFGAGCVIALLIGAAGLLSAQDEPGFGVISGTVTYQPRIALPDNAEILIELEDVSRMDAPSIVIASQRIFTQGRQVPIPYSLSYDTASITDMGSYNVRARIFVDGVLMWISDTNTPVISGGVTSADVQVVQVTPQVMPEADMPVFGTVTGTVSYPQRIALPPEAVIVVDLLDISRADAPSFTLSSQQIIANGRQVPFAFSLMYDLRTIDERGRYTVRARVLIDDQLRWTSDTIIPVITNGVLSAEIQLVQVN